MQQKIASGDLPASSYSFGFREGMIGNVHFVTIPANANASAAAKVVANFLLSPDAQLRKADPAVWGDPSVLDPQNCLTGSANHCNQECRRICRRYWLNRTQVG